MSGTRFAPGPATAYVSDEVIALTLAAGVDAETMSRCASAANWSVLLDTFADRRDAAVAMRTDDLIRIAVVGAITVDVDGLDDRQRLAGGAEWTTHEIRGGTGVTIRLSDEDPEQELAFCVDAGAVPVSVVSRRLVAAGAVSVDPFESLFGPTVARTVEAAAVRPAAGDTSRSPLGVLVFSTGERVMVDRSILMGRNPRRNDDGASDDEFGVRTVQVAGPAVSRQHAFIRVDRWHASLDDLGSSNGTRVTVPGRPTAPVQAGHPVDLVPGTVVDLGGDVTFAVEEVA